MKQKHILVVDDEGINRLFLKSLLQNNGWVVHEAEEGEEAVRMAGENVFSIILMDVNMPGIDGFEAARRIREAGIAGEDGRPVTILALSAYNDEPFYRECESAGMNGIITKPIMEHALLRKIASHEPDPEE